MPDIIEAQLPTGVHIADPDGFITAKQQFGEHAPDARKYAEWLADYSVNKLKEVLRETQEKVQRIQESTKLTREGKAEELRQLYGQMMGKVQEAGLGNKRLEQDLRKTEKSLRKSLEHDQLSDTRSVVRDEVRQPYILEKLERLAEQTGSEAHDGVLDNKAEELVLRAAEGGGDFRTILSAIESSPFEVPVRNVILERAKDRFLELNAPDAFARRQMIQSVRSLYDQNLATARKRLTEITGIAHMEQDDAIARQASGNNKQE